MESKQDIRADVLQYFTSARLAEYCAGQTGGKAGNLSGKKYRITDAGLGGLEIDEENNRAVWYLHSESIGGDVFDAFQYFEKLQDFPAQLLRGAELAGIAFPHTGSAHPTAHAAQDKPGFVNINTPFQSEYPYTDENKKPIRVKRRYPTVKGEIITDRSLYAQADGKTFRWFHYSTSGVLEHGKGNAPPMLYRFPEVLESAAKEGCVWVVEGEKDADTLAGLPLTATTAEHGAGAGESKWSAEYTSALTGAHCIIVADADEKGRKFAQQIAEAIHSNASSVRVIESPIGKDVTEYIERGGSAEGLVQLAEATDYWEPAIAQMHNEIYFPTKDNRPSAVVPLVKMHGVQICSVGNMTIITALPGTGKSAVCEAIAASAINPSADCFGIDVPMGTRVLYVDGERSINDHWWSADRARRRATLSDEEWLPEAVKFALFALMPSIEERRKELLRLIEIHNPQLLIIDGLGDFVRDANDAGDTADLIYTLTANAKSSNFGVITTIHPNPSGDRNKARGHLGSEAMRRAESVLLLERNTDGSRTLHTNFSLGKNRNAADRIATSFSWSDEARMFTSCESPKPTAMQKADKLSNLRLLAAEPIAPSALMRKIMDQELCSESTAKRRIKEMKQADMIAFNPALQYVNVGDSHREDKQ
ncbi:MAG: AAA family ATPase [Bacteroidota bacterium]